MLPVSKKKQSMLERTSNKSEYYDLILNNLNIFKTFEIHIYFNYTDFKSQ